MPQHAAYYAPVPIPMAEAVAAPAPVPFYAQMPAGYQVNPNQPPFQPIAIHNAMPYATNVTGIFIAPFEDGGDGEPLQPAPARMPPPPQPGVPPYNYNPVYPGY